MEIGNVRLENNVFLAPMAGITDKAMRMITKPFGAGLMYTEMVSGKALLYNNKKTEELLDVSEEEQPIAAQLFGHEPKVLAEIAYKATEVGAKIIDINMGCPAPKITSNGEGSALMKNPSLAGEIIKEVVGAAEAPVTVKIRKGWDEGSVNAVELAKIAEQNGASAVTVHGRTRTQFYEGTADLDIIKEVVSSVKIPVIGNGDITDGKSAKHMLDYTGCGGIMIGREAQGNPWIFKEVLTYLKSGEAVLPPMLEERCGVMKKHLLLICGLKGEARGIPESRKHMAWYVKGIRGGAKMREKIFKAQTCAEMLDIIGELEKHI